MSNLNQIHQLINGLVSYFTSIKAYGLIDISNYSISSLELRSATIDEASLKATIEDIISLCKGMKMPLEELMIDYGRTGFLNFKLYGNHLMFYLSDEGNFGQINYFVKNIKIEVDDTELLKEVQEEEKEEGETADPKLLAARNIQQSILPSPDQFDKYFKKSFIYFKPKEVIGGDFYWMKEAGDSVYFAVSDCTGHSVEGAMASMTVSSILTQVVDGKSKVNLSLKEAHERLRGFKNGVNEKNISGGIGAEIILCCYDKKKNELEYASSGIPLIHFSKGTLNVIKTKSKSKFRKELSLDDFSYEKLKLAKGDKLCFFSDGLVDQFDKNNKKKLGLNGLGKIVESIGMNGSFNHKNFKSSIDDWRGTTAQTDDTVLLGVEI